MDYKVLIIIGSVREKREGIKVVRWIYQLLNKKDYQVDLIDMKEKPLPMLNKRYIDYEPGEIPPLLQELHERLMQADGFIIITPEYNHSIPPALKNFLDHFKLEFSRKPAAIISYSTGSFGGIRVIDHLNDVLLALQITVVPLTVPITNVDKVFSVSGELLDKKYLERVEKLFKDFEWYLEALKKQRNNK